MKRLILAGACALALAGCGTLGGGGLNTFHAQMEKREIDAELIYQGTVAALDADVAAGKMSSSTHDADKLKAWQALQLARTAYNTGQAVDLTILQAQNTAAKGVQ